MKRLSTHPFNRGSIFLSVLILGVVLTLAAGAGLLLASHAANKIHATWEDNAAFYAAEGGLKRGLAWVRYEGIPVNNRTISGTANGYNVTVQVFTNGWVTSQVSVPAPTLDRPLIWSYLAKCSLVVVPNTYDPIPDSLSLHKCSRTSIPLTYP